jgi:HK97 family phage portal protein
LQKSFSLKNPGPLKKFAADLLGLEPTSVQRPYVQSVWVYRCLQIWQRIASVPVLLVDSKGTTVEKGQLANLLKQPASKKSIADFVRWSVLALGTTGEFYILREDGNKTSGVPLYLQFIWPDFIAPDMNTLRGGEVTRYEIKKQFGGVRYVPAEGVITGKFPHPYKAYHGLSPLEALRLSVDADYAARLHNKSMAAQHGRISGIVSFDEDIGSDRLKEMHKLFIEKFNNPEAAGTTAFMDNGATYTQTAMSMKDMDWLEGSKLTMTEICSGGFGVSPILAGSMDGSTFANLETAQKDLWDNTLIPIGNLIADSLTRGLVTPVVADQKIKLDYVSSVRALQLDENIRIERYIKLVTQGKVTPKSAASLTGIKLGDSHPAQDVVWLSISDVPYGEEPEEEEATPSKLLSRCKALVRAMPQEAAPLHNEDELRYELRQARGRSILRGATAWEGKAKKELKTFFWKQRSHVLKRLAQLSEFLGKSLPSGTVIKLKQNGRDIAEMLLDGEDWDKELDRRLMPTLRAAATTGAKQVRGEIGLSRDVFSEQILSSWQKSTKVLLDKVNVYTADALTALADKIQEGVTEGQPLDEMVEAFGNDVRGFYDDTEARKVRIARTETTRALNGGRFAQMQAAGIEEHEWLAVMDSAVRESHADQDGDVVRIGEKFDNGLEYPGDPNGKPEETINCRCTTVAVFKE